MIRRAQSEQENQIRYMQMVSSHMETVQANQIQRDLTRLQNNRESVSGQH